MKYLSKQIKWEEIRAIGFDLDGTLYDEFDFIKGSLEALSILSQLFNNIIIIIIALCVHLYTW